MRNFIRDGPRTDFKFELKGRIHSREERNQRLHELRRILTEKDNSEKDFKKDITDLSARLNKLSMVKSRYTEKYLIVSNELKVQVDGNSRAYEEYLESLKDHLDLNSRLMKKSKELTELEARLGMIDLGWLDSEYKRLKLIW